MFEFVNLSDDRVFYTIEGEGKFAGYPSVFMRLSNCNLTCCGFASEDSPHGCDSYVSWSKQHKYTFDELHTLFESDGYVKHLKNGAILKITGGEPLLQQSRLIKWVKSFSDKFGFIPQIDIESNSTIMPSDEWLDLKATFTISPKMSNNGDDESLRYKPDVLLWHKENGSCVKFVIQNEEDLEELFDRYINQGLLTFENVWLMPCCGSREEFMNRSEEVVEICKKHGIKFSPRLQLVVWDKALGV